ncbi:MAG: NUDIX domain-containing protein [Ruminococcus sp.]|nr:NUDIX domain-containing protein [Ruminococcus sp.]
MSDGYIMDLRKVVGHRTLIQAAASVIIMDREGRVLLGKRSDNGFWGYSGGSLEIDERVEDCARRELLEEMGLTANSLEFFMVNSGPEAHYVYPNGDEVSNVEIIYLCRDYSGEPRMADGEMTELRFFSLDDLPPISPPIRPAMERLVNAQFTMHNAQ